MTVSSLVTALLVGAALGAGARWLVPATRGVPFWVPLAVAVGAAVFATVVARFAGVDTSGVAPVEIFLQVVLAATGVALVAATADRRYSR
ncbi:GlsB/YeaQ/YmgE family stress response membrane protein [Actinoplanes sp. NPDC048796]|uniref:GlsB/YeaQ/YmgE family stress response membrane protein n=1 Tax=unclassified Actinoplanes TaxID=2626549 RepID=UPI0034006BEE